MTRITVLQRIIDKIRAKFYLEIGVEHGVVLLALRVKKRIGVDPQFKISWKRRLFYAFRMRRTRLFQMPSDEFFARHAAAIPASGIEVAFIDGLHTYAQSLADVEHCLERLAPGGVIVIHDCNPETARAASLLQDDADGPWYGDVWKTIVHLRSLRPELTVHVLDADCGLGIVTQNPAPYQNLPFSKADIDRLSYPDLEGHRAEYLGLKPPSYLEEFLESLPPV